MQTTGLIIGIHDPTPLRPQNDNLLPQMAIFITAIPILKYYFHFHLSNFTIWHTKEELPAIALELHFDAA